VLGTFFGPASLLPNNYLCASPVPGDLDCGVSYGECLVC